MRGDDRGAARSSLRTSGLTYGVDLASRDSATIGGTIATNAGGVRVVRFGDTRRRCVGVEAVFADGSVMTDRRSGQGLRRVRPVRGCWSAVKGTLAVITAVRLRLQRCPACATASPRWSGSPRLRDSRCPWRERRSSRLLAAEYVDDVGMRAGVRGRRAAAPAARPLAVLRADRDGRDARAARRRGRCGRPTGVGVPRTADRGGGHPRSGHSLDVALPTAALDDFIGRLPDWSHPYRGLHLRPPGRGQPAHPDHRPGRSTTRLDARRARASSPISVAASAPSTVSDGRSRPYLPLCRDRRRARPRWHGQAALDPTRAAQPRRAVHLRDARGWHDERS